RKLVTSSTSIPRPARMRANSSGKSWRCAMASARACPRSSRRSRQARPHAERSTPRNRRRAGPGGMVNATVMVGRESKSEKLAILNEAGAFRQLVVERAGAAVGFVGQPIDAAGAGGARPLLNRCDQRAAEPEIARAFGDEQILEIAVVASGPA